MHYTTNNTRSHRPARPSICVHVLVIRNFQFGNEQYQNWKSEIFNLVMRNIRIGKKEIFNLVIRNIQIGNHRFADDKYPNWKLVTRKFQFGNGKSANWKSVMRNFQIGNQKKLKSVIDMALLGPDLVANFVVAKLVH